MAYSWYVDYLEWIRDTAHPVLGPIVAIGEVVIGVLLIVGRFTGIAALLGSILNVSFVFAGSAGVNPAMLLVSGLLNLAWRNAGWYGLDRWVLPALGTPWQRGELVDLPALERHREATAAPVPQGRGGRPTHPLPEQPMDQGQDVARRDQAMSLVPVRDVRLGGSGHQCPPG